MTAKHSILRGQTDSVVRIDINLTRLNKYAVVCLICGGMVQNTGEGGFDTAEEAAGVVQDHRREHARLLALEIEQGETAELPTFTWPEPKPAATTFQCAACGADLHGEDDAGECPVPPEGEEGMTVEADGPWFHRPVPST